MEMEKMDTMWMVAFGFIGLSLLMYVTDKVLSKN
jgi:hypothetical protein